MIDLGRCAGLLADRDQLVDRFEQLVALGAHVTDVHPTAFRRFGGDRGQLRRLRVGRGRVDQRRADAHRSVLHRLTHQRAHLRPRSSQRFADGARHRFLPQDEREHDDTPCQDGQPDDRRDQ